VPTKPPTHRPGDRRARDRRDREWRRRRPDRVEADRLRSSATWQRLRAAYLATYPLCCDPLGRHAEEGVSVAATEVHHERPVVERPDLCYDWRNLRAICRACHAVLSRREREERRGG